MRFDNITGSETLFEEMYRDYSRERKSIDSEHRRFSVKQFRKDILEYERFLKFFITEQEDEIVGFIILLNCGDEKSKSVWFIVDFYILPEKRRKGFGTRALVHFLKTYSGDFFQFVTKQNVPAMEFWGSCIKRFDLEEKNKPDFTIPVDKVMIYVERRKTR